MHRRLTSALEESMITCARPRDLITDLPLTDKRQPSSEPIRARSCYLVQYNVAVLSGIKALCFYRFEFDPRAKGESSVAPSFGWEALIPCGGIRCCPHVKESFLHEKYGRSTKFPVTQPLALGNSL